MQAFFAKKTQKGHKMSTNFENSEEKIVNLSMEDMIFVDEILNERKIIINSPLVDVVENDLDRAATLTRYIFFYKLNNFQPFALTDQKVADSLRISVKKIERAKAWLKEHDFMSVKRVGIPAVGYITVNISKVKELYRLMESSSPYSGNWNPVFGEHIYNIPKRDILESNKENTKRSFETENNIPASGSPSSPKVDELHLAEEIFDDRFWVLVPNKVSRGKAKRRFFQITNKCKNEKKVNEVVEGYKRYLNYLNECKKHNFNRRPKDPSTFLNVENEEWLGEWEFVEEEPVKKEVSSQIQQPKDLERRIRIARKLKLLDNFLPDEYDREWKFIPKEVKEILISKDVENYIKDIKTSEETLITQIACVTMIGKDGYMTWKDKYEEETGERPTYDLEFYIPFGKKLTNDIWKWLLKYSHNFGLPSERKINEARQWYYKSDHSAAWNLFA